MVFIVINSTNNVDYFFLTKMAPKKLLLLIAWLPLSPFDSVLDDGRVRVKVELIGQPDNQTNQEKKPNIEINF